MGWAKFDDRWATHAKLLAAGLEAAGLDARAICWCAGQETDGFVPDAAVTLLAAGHRNPAKLAGVLVTVGRWSRNQERKGYDIHDYLDYNPTRESREAERDKKREAGRLGGVNSGAKRTRSRNEAECLRSASENPNHNASTNEADWFNFSEPPSRPVPSPSSSSVLNHQVGPQPDDEDDDESRCRKALAMVVDRRIAAIGSRIENPRAYRRSVAASVAEEFGDESLKLAAQGMSAEQIADAIEPPPPPAVSPYADRPPLELVEELVEVDGRMVLVARPA